MGFLEFATGTFALIGLFAVARFAYYNGPWRVVRGDDAPIRVKGGSMFRGEHMNADWELDEDDDEREYPVKGQQNGWKVDVWKNQADMDSGAIPLTLYGRRVIVHVDDGSGRPADYRLKFRSNGSARVVDQDRKLTHVAKLLQNTGAGHRITRVVAKTKGSPDQVHAFAASEKGFIKLWPQP